MPDPALLRREFLANLSALGLTSALLPASLAAQERSRITPEMIELAEQVAGTELTDGQRRLMQRSLDRNRAGYERLRRIPLPNGVAPAIRFDPAPGVKLPAPAQSEDPAATPPTIEMPDDIEELAFYPVRDLAELVRTQAVSARELTEMYLSRLKFYDKSLKCVITMLEDQALAAADHADEEIEAGHYRGPLHGIPWGAKDLLHTRGIRTTYGAEPFENQIVDEDATVIERLRDAGAILIAKLSLGALAMGDVWFGGRTRNPWNTEQGSSGSSAGPAAATAAGLVGFAIGTETLGSIVSPCSRCGATGLRPTFGRVSRAGAMALSWTMDKIGPIGRTVEDCALVLEAIHGADPRDPTAADIPFHWNRERRVQELRVGYVKSLFSEERRDKGQAECDRATLEALRSLGVDLVPIELPDFPTTEMMIILNAEAAAAFDEITRNGEVDKMVRQEADAWPNVFRTSQFIPAVEYIRANRIRTLLMQEMAKATAAVDLFVAPAFAGPTLGITNLTGHPAVVLPNGFREDSTPMSITFIGKLYGEADLLAAAHSYQEATDFHRRHPPLD
ncbi:MAG: amidase [Planctomycetota bacterium]